MCVCICRGGGASVCGYMKGGGSVAPQIEIDGQDYSDEDDGSEDEDQDTILDDPALKRKRDMGQVC